MAIRIFESTTRPNNAMPVRRAPFPVSQESATIDGTSRQSAAFSDETLLVTIQPDSACHVVFGGNPTATTAGFKIAAGETADFEVVGGDKVAWISG